jgi:hypothetical protein
LDFADWELCDAINKLKHFVAYLTNNPPKSSLENGGLYSYYISEYIVTLKTICRFTHLNTFTHDANNPPKSSLENGGLYFYYNFKFIITLDNQPILTLNMSPLWGS